MAKLKSFKNIRFVVATEHNKQTFENTDFFKFKHYVTKNLPIYNQPLFSIHYENNEGLPKIYNQYITEKYKNEYVIFVHDDVQIADIFYYEKILNGLSEYNIIGLAGTSKIVNTEVPAWHLLAGWQTPGVGTSHSLGEVTHRFPGNNINTTVFGPNNKRALLIDGLFIGTDIQYLLQNNVTFDETFYFHHYDLSFCLRANSAKLTIGIIQLFCIHAGLGDSMNTKEWQDSAVKFKQKYLK